MPKIFGARQPDSCNSAFFDQEPIWIVDSSPRNSFRLYLIYMTG